LIININYEKAWYPEKNKISLDEKENARSGKKAHQKKKGKSLEAIIL